MQAVTDGFGQERADSGRDGRKRASNGQAGQSRTSLPSADNVVQAVALRARSPYHPRHGCDGAGALPPAAARAVHILPAP
jgi:hypothetical protein